MVTQHITSKVNLSGVVDHRICWSGKDVIREFRGRGRADMKNRESSIYRAQRYEIRCQKLDWAKLDNKVELDKVELQRVK